MRSFIIIAVLSALAASYGTPVLPSGEETYPEYKMIHKYNKEDDFQNRITILREGMRHDNDRQDGLVLLDEQRFIRTAIPDVIQHVDILYYGKPPTVITTVEITSSPPPSLVFPVWHLDNYISIRISSQRGLGMNATVQIFGTL
ncbi:uncharacterized protein LOC111350951 [Spodoptera litura]|uniref:Uncharacterized protein LOC111350951 n=1 Tax=Spodoptera litura TaxID=69820 RepID=A0A9J7DYN3_SPOLT|nr:uncharacterized protein LOC111350951 [Spodoptera litura]XP_022818448.1 uncharacterized protein LOC111350951 [Spodoptera litura]